MISTIKYKLAKEIIKKFEASSQTQKEFGLVLGIRQAKVSRLTQGHLSEFSMETLIIYLQNLNMCVDISIKENIFLG